MKTKVIILLLAGMIIFPATANAQVGSLLKNKLNKVVNAGTKTADKDIDNQIDTAAQKSAERAGSGENQSQDQGQPGAGMGKLFGNKIDLKYKEEYAFTSRIYMITETYDKKDVLKMDFYMYYSKNSPSVGVETKTISDESSEATPIASTMVMDGENKCFLMLTDMNGMKMGMISAVPDENSDQQTDGKKDAPPVFTKTGNSRVIAGYKCDEYTYVDPDDKTTGKVWFTKEANLLIDKRGWKNTGMSAYYGNEEFSEGIILANESYDDKGKLTMKSETIEINPDYPHSISVTGYTLRQMNMGQKEKKEKK